MVILCGDDVMFLGSYGVKYKEDLKLLLFKGYLKKTLLATQRKLGLIYEYLAMDNTELNTNTTTREIHVTVMNQNKPKISALVIGGENNPNC